GSITISGTTYSTGDSLSYTEEIKDTSPTFKLGAVIDETHRVYLRYQDFEEDSSGGKITTLNYEYMFGEDNDKYRPYLGVHAGHGKIEDDYVSGSGLVYGAQAGIIVPIAKGFEFEAGIAYITSNIEYKGTWPTLNGSYEFINDGTPFTATNAVIQDSGDFDKAVSMSMGINYKF
ncbi:MAG: hypothetical protein H8E76_00215, partial [Helicobacteraceae bacterium]|nr:hypothetical protein [Candidatus Sulfurimonas ponti]